MARARNIKPTFFKNERLVELPFEARLLFIGLWTMADREGRLEDRPKRIKMELFPADDVDTDHLLNLLAEQELIVRYTADGLACIAVPKFTKHQNPHYKEVPSELPAPPGAEAPDYGATPVPEKTRQSVFARDGFQCQTCGADSNLTIDHVVPRSKGGTSEPDNLQTLCRSCNTSKGNKTDYEATAGQPRTELEPNSARERTLIPDSLNLIPDSPSLIPDTGYHEEISSPAEPAPAAPTNPNRGAVPYQDIVDEYHRLCPSLPSVRSITDKRRRAMRIWWSSELGNMDTVRELFSKAEESEFLSGRNTKWTGCNFDWLINKNNALKVLEGTYSERASPGGNGRTISTGAKRALDVARRYMQEEEAESHDQG